MRSRLGQRDGSFLRPAAAIDALGAQRDRTVRGSVTPDLSVRREVIAASRTTQIDPLAGNEWDSFVANYADATVFHTSAWCRVLAETYGHKPFYHRFVDEAGNVVLLPLVEVYSSLTGRRGVSLPFSDFCPPLATGAFDRNSLVRELASLAEAQKWKHFELRGASVFHQSAPAASTYFGHSLDLTNGVEAIERQFADNVHRNIRKAERSALQLDISTSKQALHEFYHLLTRTRRRHGVPPQPLRFFDKIYQHIIAQDLGFTVLARRERRAIAGAVFFRFGGNALFKFGASDERLQELRANNLVMHEAIRHLIETGAKRLHFGRTDRTNEGLRRFKLAWGAEEEILEYFRFQRASGRWVIAGPDLAGRAAPVFRHLPLVANRLIGTIAYPHLD